MDYIRGLEAYQDSREAAITLGKFDGVHRGHQKLIKKVCQLKVKKGVRSVVFAFDMNPLYEKLGKSREGIMSNEERRCLLDGKVDVLLECPFSEDVTSMSAEDFIRKILIEKIHQKATALNPQTNERHIQLFVRPFDLYDGRHRAPRKQNRCARQGSKSQKTSTRRCHNSPF